jgi:4'-phosphopantetheinyl transferase EntD
MTVAQRLGPIEASLASLFPQGVAVAAERIVPGRDSTLWPDELAAIAGAVPARRAEFAAGRTAARRCLAALGQSLTSLPISSDRAADWPRGVFGSISHAAGVAVAVAGMKTPLGVDLDVDAGLEADLWPVICPAGEMLELPDKDVGRHVRQIFAAKEAVFKAQMPTTRAMFGFEVVQVRLTDVGFVAKYVQDAGSFSAGTELRGRLAFVQGLIIAGVMA